MSDDLDEIIERVSAKSIDKMIREGRPLGIISSAIWDGMLKGFVESRNAAKIRRLMRQDAKRLKILAEELRDWDVGDDHETAAQVESIALRLSDLYRLKIGA